MPDQLDNASSPVENRPNIQQIGERLGTTRNGWKAAIEAGRLKVVTFGNTDFDMLSKERIQQVVPLGHQYEGNGIFVRGKVNEDQSDLLYNFFRDNVNSRKNGYEDKLKAGAFSVTVAEPPLEHVLMKDGFVKPGDKIVEFRWAQLEPNGKGRKWTEKHVVAVMPNIMADNLVGIINDGARPWQLHDFIADVVTTPQTRPFFDTASMYDAKGQYKPVPAELPKWKEVYLSSQDTSIETKHDWRGRRIIAPPKMLRKAIPNPDLQNQPNPKVIRIEDDTPQFVKKQKPVEFIEEGTDFDLDMADKKLKTVKL